MGKQSYVKYLESSHWKQLRAAKLEQQHFLCESCRSSSQLEVHHLRYRQLTNCTLEDLMVLCNTCHVDLHDATKFFSIPKPKRSTQASQIIIDYRSSNLPITRKQRIEKRMHRQFRTEKRKTISNQVRWAIKVCIENKYNEASCFALRDRLNELMP